VGIFDRTSVVHGDEGCRDGHCRVKDKLLEMVVSEDGTEQKLDPNAPIALHAQNPTELARRCESGLGIQGRSGDSGNLEHNALRHWRYGRDASSRGVSEDQPYNTTTNLLDATHNFWGCFLGANSVNNCDVDNAGASVFSRDEQKSKSVSGCIPA
jgi:hypothetical protein